MIALGCCLLTLSCNFGSVESSLRRVKAHLLIGDSARAVSEVVQVLQEYPDEPLVYEMALKSFAASGKDAEMFKLWHLFHEKFPEKAYANDVLEEMCWGILKKGTQAASISSQLICVIGAALTQDIRALPFLHDGMAHSNVVIRTLSVKLAALYRDYPLREEIVRLFREEKTEDVRLEILQAIGQLRLEFLVTELMQKLADPKCSAKEQAMIIQTLTVMRDQVDAHEIEKLIKNKRAGLRQLACEVICHTKEHTEHLLTLIQDCNPQVRKAALGTIGLLRLKDPHFISAVRAQVRDERNPFVAITACWVLFLSDQERAEENLMPWLTHEDADVRALAASAITAAGSYGIPLAKKLFKTVKDPYVQANLCIALIGQREEVQDAAFLLDQFLTTHTENCALATEGLLRPLHKSTVGHNAAIPHFPELVDQTVRLRLLNMLAILEYPGAQASIKSFLKKRKWNVTGLAAEMLLSEGDETELDAIRLFLDDPDMEIRSEAALVLATIGRDPTAVPVLLKIYPQADRSLQLKILESLGRIGGLMGDIQVTTFLVERLQEPSLMLRMIAASVLVQILHQ